MEHTFHLFVPQHGFCLVSATVFVFTRGAQHASRGCDTCRTGRCCSGSQNGQASPHRPRLRRGSRAKTPRSRPQDRSAPRSDTRRTSPSTIPTRYRSCRTVPVRWASSSRLPACFRRCLR